MNNKEMNADLQALYIKQLRDLGEFLVKNASNIANDGTHYNSIDIFMKIDAENYAPSISITKNY